MDIRFGVRGRFGGLRHGNGACLKGAARAAFCLATVRKDRIASAQRTMQRPPNRRA